MKDDARRRDDETTRRDETHTHLRPVDVCCDTNEPWTRNGGDKRQQRRQRRQRRRQKQTRRRDGRWIAGCRMQDGCWSSLTHEELLMPTCKSLHDHRYILLPHHHHHHHHHHCNNNINININNNSSFHHHASRTVRSPALSLAPAAAPLLQLADCHFVCCSRPSAAAWLLG